MLSAEQHGWEGFREGVDYPGRPDLGAHKIDDWGVVKAKKFLPYVHSTAGNALLIHKVACVKIRWYQGWWNYMKHLEQPSLCAETVCGLRRCARFQTLALYFAVDAMGNSLRFLADARCASRNNGLKIISAARARMWL
jgi:hypothetical protein